uniref:Kringle domain-containing protein n=1 Tax=Astyanax mexicanus TaxID=7994 RepID=A0A3B1JB59_ASTMX
MCLHSLNQRPDNTVLLVLLKSEQGPQDVLDAYTKTDGAWILTLMKSNYIVRSVQECAVKCNTETSFTCRSFMYIEKDQDCITIPANSKIEPILRRRSITLYEKIVYLLECVIGIGTDYRGTKSKTKSGTLCQRWESTFPHKPKYVFFLKLSIFMLQNVSVSN